MAALGEFCESRTHIQLLQVQHNQPYERLLRRRIRLRWDTTICRRDASSREARAAQAEVSRLSEILITLQQAVIALQPSSTSRPAPQQPVVQATPTSYRVSLPSNLPKFKRHVDPSSSPLGAREFLTSFEDRLRAHGYPTDRFVDTLLTACAPPMRRTGAVPSSATSRGTRPVARSWSTTPVATSSPTTASAWSSWRAARAKACSRRWR